MASIDKRPDGRYRARWREYPGGPQRAEHFARKKDAEVFLVNIQHRLLAGTYTPPEAGRITVAAYAEEWRGRRRWRASTEERVDGELRLHIIPLLGKRPLASLRRSHIEEWAAALPLAPSSVKTAHRTPSAMLGAAVEDERIPRNPASGASLPKVEENLVVPMTVDEVRAVAAAITEPARAAIVVAAGTGLRQGELFGLTVDRIDFLRRELRVDRQLWTDRTGVPRFAPPKSKNGFRTVALSPLVVEAVSAQVAAYGPGTDGLVFHSDGRPIPRWKGGTWIAAAVTKAAAAAAEAASKAAKGKAELEVAQLVEAARAAFSTG